MKHAFLKKNLEELLRRTITQVKELEDSKSQLQGVIEEREKVVGYISCSIAGVDYRKSLKKKKALTNDEEYVDDIADLPCYTEAADESLIAADHLKRLAKAIRRTVHDEILATKLSQKTIHSTINQTLGKKRSETR